MRGCAPLEGVKVVDVTRALAGPYCSMMLADLGAEVIKLESPVKGDESRAWGPPFVNGESAYFMSVNRNKKSVALDFRSPGARKVLTRLVRGADVFIENYRPGTAESLGVGYEALRKVNPRLIYCSISGFGQTGPRRDMPGYDIVALALSGMMSITGEPGRPPVKMGVPVSDIGAGMFAAFAIVSSLYGRGRTGEGERIDVSLLDGQVAWLTHQAASYFASGKVPRPLGSAHPQIAPYQAFRAKDGYFIVAAGNDAQWKALLEVLPADTALRSRAYSTNARRVGNREKLERELTSLFSRRTASSWVRSISKAGVPACTINTVAEALSDPQTVARGMVMEVRHPKAGIVRQLGMPFKLGGYRFSIRAPPPVLGQHTNEVLRGLGFSPTQIGRLRRRGVVA
ncbi:MAG TPA: CoA transferase [Conexivisphaerales archaeon]|nr:CoA transferase [Conexivisphaerales archaeon]